MDEVVVIIIVIVVLLVVISLLLFYVTKRVNLLVKGIFIDRLQEFDFLLEDKEKKVNELNDSITIQKKQLKELEEKVSSLYDYKLSRTSNTAVLPKFANLEDFSLLSSYKKIKDNFNFNVVEIIKRFVSNNNTNNNNLYNIYKKIREYFTYEVFYKISTFQSSEQFIIVKDLLSDEEREAVKSILVKYKFSIKKFVNDLDELLIKNSPQIIVYVGDKKASYDYIDSNVETIYTDSITEGFRIEYKGMVYDFSI